MDADETSIDALQGFISAVHNRMADAAPRLIVLSLKSIDGIPVPAGSTRIIEKPALPRVLFDETVRLVWQRAGPSPDRLEKKSEKQRDFAESRPMRILVVEDNPINSRVIGLILKKLGYTCDLAENGRIALERLSANNYEVVFMDLQMPEVDGLEATRRIRKATPFTEPPYIIALTANAREEDRKACAEAGMHAFQSKPAHVEKISNALEEAWDWLQVHGCPRTSS
jgi:CheY-like chemotaxis protein